MTNRDEVLSYLSAVESCIWIQDRTNEIWFDCGLLKNKEKQEKIDDEKERVTWYVTPLLWSYDQKTIPIRKFIADSPYASIEGRLWDFSRYPYKFQYFWHTFYVELNKKWEIAFKLEDYRVDPHWIIIIGEVSIKNRLRCALINKLFTWILSKNISGQVLNLPPRFYEKLEYITPVDITWIPNVEQYDNVVRKKFMSWPHMSNESEFHKEGEEVRCRLRVRVEEDLITLYRIPKRNKEEIQYKESKKTPWEVHTLLPEPYKVTFNLDDLLDAFTKLG